MSKIRWGILGTGATRKLAEALQYLDEAEM